MTGVRYVCQHWWRLGCKPPAVEHERSHSEQGSAQALKSLW